VEALSIEPGPLDRLTLVRASLRELKLPGHVLRRTATEVDFQAISARERTILARELLTAMHRDGGIGLAAPMAGVSLRVIVAIGADETLVMFNPVIEQAGGETTSAREANLCLPGVSASVERPAAVTVKWQDIDGQVQKGSFDGAIARTLQHELELLDGEIFTDIAAKETIVTASLDERAAAVTSYVFEKKAPSSAEVNSTIQPRCVTLPPSLLGIVESVLRRPAEKVQPDRFKRNQLRNLVEGMFRAQYGRRGVGLAAPQIGIGLQLAVIDNHQDEPIVLLNPELLEADDGDEALPEGCLSIPGWQGVVARSSRIRIRNQTLAGKPYELRAEGQLARVIQHEFDHLNGVLYPDRIVAPETLERSDPHALAEAGLSHPLSPSPPPPSV
jgi:peptide deformylase